MRTLLLALIGLLLWSVPASAAEQPDAHLSRVPGLMLADSPAWTPAADPRLAQANPAWSQFVYHTSRRGLERTLGRKGCAIFSAYIAIQRLGYRGTPLDFATYLRDSDCFDDRGRIRWECIDELGSVSTSRVAATGEDAFARITAELATGYVAVQLRTATSREHWIAVVGVSGNDFRYIDPAGGRTGLLRSTFGVGAIRGFTSFQPLVRIAARQ